MPVVIPLHFCSPVHSISIDSQTTWMSAIKQWPSDFFNVLPWQISIVFLIAIHNFYTYTLTFVYNILLPELPVPPHCSKAPLALPCSFSEYLMSTIFPMNNYKLQVQWWLEVDIQFGQLGKLEASLDELKLILPFWLSQADSKSTYSNAWQTTVDLRSLHMIWLSFDIFIVV